MSAFPESVRRGFVERCRVERAAAGLPEHLEDPVVLDRIAAIVVVATQRQN